MCHYNVRNKSITENEDVILFGLKTLKILSRKEENRKFLDPPLVANLVNILHAPKSVTVACEVSNGEIKKNLQKLTSFEN